MYYKNKKRYITHEEGDSLFTEMWNSQIYYEKSECPVCGSTNTVTLKHKNKFWGCKDCKYGFIEQLLYDIVRDITREKLELDDYSEYYITVFKDKAIKPVEKKIIKQKEKVDAIQLSLF